MNKLILIEDKSKCTGCNACMQICPAKCIEMKRDAEGFWYPVADKDKCLKCNACVNACPVINCGKVHSGNLHLSNENETGDAKTIRKNETESDEKAGCGNETESDEKAGCGNENESDDKAGCGNGLEQCKVLAYGCRNRDEDVRYKSSSGGVFSAFAKEIIEDGGVVFACVLKGKKAVIEKTCDISGLEAMRGSKYVQCDTQNAYSEIKEILASNRKVLFVGTPCQTAGLYSFLGYREYPNLFTMDFICHGVPSPKLFEDYVDSIESKNKSKVTSFKFRNKDKGWSQTGLQLGTYYELKNGKTVRNYPAFKDRYMNAFLDDVALRPSCYDCRFKSIPKSYADYTVADFWGISKIIPELNDKKGTSLLLVHSKKGEEYLKEIAEALEALPVGFKESVKRNPPLLKSAVRYKRRDRFFEDYEKYGYDYVEKKYMSAFKWGTHKAFSVFGSIWKRFEQFIKFGIVGISNTVICLAVYYLGLLVGIDYRISYTLGFLASVCNAFYWNNKYVFKNKQEKSILKAFAKVFASYGLSFVISIILMNIFVELLHIPSVIAPLLKLVVTIPINFVLNKVWAFKDKKIK
ncbi:MAG: Coenzyme F420 hydrogenase/dehydrogenase, beta subunit C-terminal domain [Lachnospiraceae bacterium]|nr:Coenzyme F420 hydrogenase/dehydrogenase, beta subunit C-terminal domain [Lachnospiraceae bacterium]